jgi:hypothetical protein
MIRFAAPLALLLACAATAPAPAPEAASRPLDDFAEIPFDRCTPALVGYFVTPEALVDLAAALDRRDRECEKRVNTANTHRELADRRANSAQAISGARGFGLGFGAGAGTAAAAAILIYLLVRAVAPQP